MDESYKWIHMMHELWWPASFTQHNVVKVHPHRSMYPCSVPFYGQVTFHRMGIPHFIHPFISRWTLRLFPLLWITLLRTFVYEFLHGCVFLFLLGIVPASEILSHVVALRLAFCRRELLFEMCWCCHLACPVILLLAPSSPPDPSCPIHHPGCRWELCRLPACDLAQVIHASPSLHFSAVKWGWRWACWRNVLQCLAASQPMLHC